MHIIQNITLARPLTSWYRLKWYSLDSPLLLEERTLNGPINVPEHCSTSSAVILAMCWPNEIIPAHMMHALLSTLCKMFVNFLNHHDRKNYLLFYRYQTGDTWTIQLAHLQLLYHLQLLLYWVKRCKRLGIMYRSILSDICMFVCT